MRNTTKTSTKVSQVTAYFVWNSRKHTFKLCQVVHKAQT